MQRHWEPYNLLFEVELQVKQLSGYPEQVSHVNEHSEHSYPVLYEPSKH